MDQDLYIWSEALHASARKSLKILDNKNAIPLNLYLNGSRIVGVSLTDWAKNTKWHHNPKVKDAIIKNKWIKLYADSEALQDPNFIGYYDESIVGLWHEMKVASENVEKIQHLSDYTRSYIKVANQNLKDKVKSLLPKLAKKAQEEYDAWDEENVDEYAGGGICHIIADELSDVLSQNDIDAASITHPFKQHVYNIAFDTETKTAITIDLPEYTYETGGGFSWKKTPDVEITPQDFIIEEVNWDDLFDENDELIDF